MNALVRASTTLKYLALLIFCVEFLTPVFFFASADKTSTDQVHAHLQDHKQSTVSLATLFAEESINEGEREGGRSKDQAISCDFQFSFSFLSQHKSVKSVVPFITQNQLHRVTPPLYQLHCLLLI
jgi:hypothetical protein